MADVAVVLRSRWWLIKFISDEYGVESRSCRWMSTEHRANGCGRTTDMIATAVPSFFLT